MSVSVTPARMKELLDRTWFVGFLYGWFVGMLGAIWGNSWFR